MFSSWDLVRPRFWYAGAVHDGARADERQDDATALPVQHGACDVFTAPKHGEDEENSDDDDFFVDLPLVARKYEPMAFRLAEIAPGEGEDEVSVDVSNAKSEDNANLDTDINNDMEVDDEGSGKMNKAKGSTKSVKTSHKTEGKAKANGNKNTKHSKQLRHHSYKVTPTSGRKVVPKADVECRTFSSYSFSNSSVVDDKGRHVTTTRRRYEDSTGRLKAAHEREIDGKKLRTTWCQQSKEDEDQHESICSSCSPEEFEALWQQTPLVRRRRRR